MNRIWYFLVFIAVAGCQTVNIPEPYNYKVKELQKNPFGCLMEITINPAGYLMEINPLKGELLAMRTDSTFLLTADGVVNRIGNFSISSARLYTHKNQSGTYLLTTGLLLIPNVIGAVAYPEYAGGFLSLGIPAFLLGVGKAAIESKQQRNILLYPQKDKLEDFVKFARFPLGIPENIDLRLLYLKNM